MTSCSARGGSVVVSFPTEAFDEWRYATEICGLDCNSNEPASKPASKPASLLRPAEVF